MEEFDLPKPVVVPEQAEPDPEFSTVKFPVRRAPLNFKRDAVWCVGLRNSDMSQTRGFHSHSSH
eukprot:4801792-Pyramimonas_sp.AAC.1